jgi:hypothetical protein
MNRRGTPLGRVAGGERAGGGTGYGRPASITTLSGLSDSESMPASTSKAAQSG